MTSRVFLVGFMGSGKTTLGRLLAIQLNYSFLDLDEWIEQREGKSIAEIFSTQGETRFREVERDSLRALETRENLVISSGGGTPCHHENMEWMNQHGITIFLNPSAEILYNRLQDQKVHRPLISELDSISLKTLIETRLVERMPYYTQSRIELISMPNAEDSVKYLIGVLSH